MAFTSGLGMMFAPFYGAAVESMGWNQTALVVLLPVALAAFVVTLFIKSDGKLAKEDAERTSADS
jgi:hypothetical protein